MGQGGAAAAARTCKGVLDRMNRINRMGQAQALQKDAKQARIEIISSLAPAPVWAISHDSNRFGLFQGVLHSKNAGQFECDVA